MRQQKPLSLVRHRPCLQITLHLGPCCSHIHSPARNELHITIFHPPRNFTGKILVPIFAGILQISVGSNSWPGSTGSLSWSCGGEQTGSIRYRVEQDALVLRYRHRSYGEDWQDVEERVRFDRTHCNYGGDCAFGSSAHIAAVGLPSSTALKSDSSAVTATICRTLARTRPTWTE